MPLNATHHIALCTPNFATMRAFYVETLGLEQIGAFPNRNVIFLSAGSTVIELVEKAGTPEPNGLGWAHYAFQVENTDATAAELKAQGIAFHVEPKDFPPEAPSVRIAFFRDPDGNEIELVQALTDGYPQPTL